jgi:myo-inositol-1(or 4)-monophosphatase
MLQPWDVAAAAVIIAEAGGVVTTPAGQQWRLGLGQVAASNGRLHAEVVGALDASSG